MRLASLLSSALLLLAVAPACVGDAADSADLGSPTDDDVSRRGLEQIVIVPTPSRPVTTPTDRNVRIPDSEPAPAPAPAACLCPDDACVRDWIAAEMGCGLCVHLVCGDDDHRGGCVACPDAP